MSYELPFIIIHLPPLDGMDQIDGAAAMRPQAIVGTVFRYPLAHHFSLLFCATADAVRKHGHTDPLHAANKRRLEFQHLRMGTLTDGPALLLPPRFRGEKFPVDQPP